MGAVEIQSEDGKLNLILKGKLDAFSTGPAWQRSINAVNEKRPAILLIKADEVNYCDAAGIAFITQLIRIKVEVPFGRLRGRLGGADKLGYDREPGSGRDGSTASYARVRHGSPARLR